DVVDDAVERVLEELDALGNRKERRLVMRVVDDADDDAVEDLRGSRDDVDVAVRDRVIGAGVDSGDHSSNSVSRAEPYLREVRSVRPGTEGGGSRPAVSQTSTPSCVRRRARCGARRP